MPVEKILDNAVLRLGQMPEGRGLRVHEHADCLTADVLRALQEHGWIEWRLWVQTEHGLRLQLKDGSWTSAQAEWQRLLAEYTGDISPEIQLTRYKGRNHAAELRLGTFGGQGGVGSNVGNKMEIIMGDKYENVQGSTVVSRSEVKSSFNRTRDDHSTKGATRGVWKWLTTGLWSFIKKRFGS